MKTFITLVAALLLSLQSQAAEQIDLTTPYDPTPDIVNTLKLSSIELDWEGQEINIDLIENGVKVRFSYEGTEATNLMKALNKANLTNNSLHKRIFNQLINDGKLDGTVSGSPE